MLQLSPALSYKVGLGLVQPLGGAFPAEICCLEAAWEDGFGRGGGGVPEGRHRVTDPPGLSVSLENRLLGQEAGRGQVRQTYLQK